MYKTITKEQAAKIAEIFEFTGETFQEVARKAGIKNVPDHLSEITEEEAGMILRRYNIKI